MITDSPTRWLKVYWHALWRIWAKRPHRPCSMTYVHFGRLDFCECGYPDDHQLFVERFKEFKRTGK